MKPANTSQKHFANEGEVTRSDQTLLESATGRSPTRDPADITPESPLDEGAPLMDVAAIPRSQVTGHVGPGNDEETEDGLSEAEAALQQAAEGRRGPDPDSI